MKGTAKIVLRALLDHFKLSTREFEIEIGAGDSTVKKALQRDSDVSRDLIEKITSRWPEISESWLSTGEGDMFAKSSDIVEAHLETGNALLAEVTKPENMKKYTKKQIDAIKRAIDSMHEIADVIKYLDRKEKK